MTLVTLDRNVDLNMDSLIYLIGIVAAIWVIYDVITHQPGMDPLKKFLWILAAIIFNILTSIIYYLTVKKNLWYLVYQLLPFRTVSIKSGFKLFVSIIGLV